MKRKENESFEAYKKRRIQDRLVQETMLDGIFRNKTSGAPTYVSAMFNKAKYQRLMRKLARRKGVPA